ncbi:MULTISPECIES: flavin reductase family protein [Caballeronia]|uniref:flavin reductase family protein n=1 Tax=Caballeronia TaxID=1827195 RepID=UPI001FD0D410|nr:MULTISPECIES: flavin reductase family protein [Caballeronia]MDR5799106.1 flavin reductase family protein [Caballeronia sp. LZ001]
MTDDQLLAASLKIAMRKMPSAVSLITALDVEQGRPVGMAVSAVIPVAMDPPSMLISINHSTSLHPVLTRHRRFCVNMLTDTHSDLVRLFSDPSRRAERFSGKDWSTQDELPFLRDALSNIFCDVEGSTTFGTHELFIGRVTDVKTKPDSQPLGWLEGECARLLPLATFA